MVSYDKYGEPGRYTFSHNERCRVVHLQPTRWRGGTDTESGAMTSQLAAADVGRLLVWIRAARWRVGGMDHTDTVIDYCQLHHQISG